MEETYRKFLTENKGVDGKAKEMIDIQKRRKRNAINSRKIRLYKRFPDKWDEILELLK